MAQTDLRSKSIEDVLNDATGLSTVGSPEQVQSFLAVFARCTIDLGENLQAVAAEMKAASATAQSNLQALSSALANVRSEMRAASIAADTNLKGLNAELSETRGQLKAASDSASDQAGALANWTKVLVVVTGIYTLLTGGLLLNAIFG